MPVIRGKSSLPKPLSFEQKSIKRSSPTQLFDRSSWMIFLDSGASPCFACPHSERGAPSTFWRSETKSAAGAPLAFSTMQEYLDELSSISAPLCLLAFCHRCRTVPFCPFIRPKSFEFVAVQPWAVTTSRCLLMTCTPFKLDGWRHAPACKSERPTFSPSFHAKDFNARKFTRKSSKSWPPGSGPFPMAV